MSKIIRVMLSAFAVALFAGFANAAQPTVVLSVYEGYDFTSRSVTRSGDRNADVSFFAGAGSASALSARKIKEMGAVEPNAPAFMGINAWNNAVNTPAPGYYGVLGKDGRSIYLIQVLEFENQGKSASRWKLHFSWQKLL